MSRYYVGEYIRHSDDKFYMAFESISEHNTETHIIIEAIKDYYSDNEYIDSYHQNYDYLFSTI